MGLSRVSRGRRARGRDGGAIRAVLGTGDRFDRHQPPIWAATFEVFGQIDRVPDIRCAIADALQGGRLAWASLLQGIDAAVDPKQAQAVGSFYQALLTGVPMQGSVDPERPRQLVTSLTR